MAVTNSRTRIDCAGHRLNTAINTAWKCVLDKSGELKQLNDDYHQLVSYVNHASDVQEELPCTLKHGGVTRPWRSLYSMFYSVRKSSEKLREILVPCKREHLIIRINTNLLNLVTEFLKPMASVFDKLEYANVPALQNVLPSFYLLQNKWESSRDDCPNTRLLKKQFTQAINDKVIALLSRSCNVMLYVVYITYLFVYHSQV